MTDQEQPSTGTCRGTTPSEVYLAKLATKAFLFLWAYPNLFRDQGKSGPGSVGKELCDLMVVVDRHVLLFSDKHCAFDTSKPVQTAWQRWYRAAILKSAKQILGAERWVRQFPQRVFLDPECTRPLPIRLPDRPLIHRILTCRGIAQSCTDAFGGPGSLLTSNMRIEQGLKEPFRLGSFGADEVFFHVFDEIALDGVLQTLDTSTDFCRYLKKREAFFRRYPSILAAGEEELLGAYLWTSDEDGGHSFPDDLSATHISIDTGFWESWVTSKQCAAKAQADEISYSWDLLIEKFAFHLLNGTSTDPTPGGVSEVEPALRWMAREDRVRRRGLVRSLYEMMATTSVGHLRKRIVAPLIDGDPYWVFLVFPQPPTLDHPTYTRFRREYLYCHCLVAKHLFPNALDICGIAVEPREEHLSEDVLSMDARDWPAELANEARRLHEEEGLFSEVRRIKATDWEYPIDGQSRTEAEDDA